MLDKERIKSCDVIIPVYNNEDVLLYTLPALFNQEIPSGWQMRLVVVDDGSCDKTVQVVRDIKTPTLWQDSVVIKQEHAGAAKARNKGIDASTAEIIFLLGADIVLLPGTIKKHLLWHKKNADRTQAALGMVKWDPRINPSPYMEWMVHGGQQNNFDDLLDKKEASPEHCFYGSHLSIKRDMLRDEKFSEAFDVYGWEDLELGRRLSKKGLKLNVLTDAMGLHHHYYKVSKIFQRQQAIGVGIMKYQNMYPEEDILPKSSFWKKWRRLFIIHSGLLRLLGWILEKTGTKISTPRLFLHVNALYFWKGVYNVKMYDTAKNS